MKFVIRLPTSNRVSSPAAIVATAQLAEELGFWAVSGHDHLVFNGAWVACGSRDARGEGNDRDMYELVTTLAFVAGMTTRVRLLTGILLLPVRETILAAKQIATLDALSGGRMLVGIGVGASGPGRKDASTHLNLGDHAVNAEREYRALGVPRRRGALVDEQLSAMRAIWTDERASYAGEFVEFEDVEIFPKPRQPGGPPILIGGSSHLARRRALRHGDGWLPNSLSPEELAEGVEQLGRETPRREQRHIGVNIFTVVDRSDEEAATLARGTVGGAFGDDQLVRRNLIGSPPAVAEKVRAYAAAGATFIEMKPIYRDVADLHRTMRLIADELFDTFAEPA